MKFRVEHSLVAFSNHFSFVSYHPKSQLGRQQLLLLKASFPAMLILCGPSEHSIITTPMVHNNYVTSSGAEGGLVSYVGRGFAKYDN